VVALFHCSTVLFVRLGRLARPSGLVPALDPTVRLPQPLVTLMQRRLGVLQAALLGMPVALAQLLV